MQRVAEDWWSLKIDAYCFLLTKLIICFLSEQKTCNDFPSRRSMSWVHYTLQFIVIPISFTEEFSATLRPRSWGLATFPLILFDVPCRVVKLEHFFRFKSREFCLLHASRAEKCSCRLVKVAKTALWTSVSLSANRNASKNKKVSGRW